MNTIELDSMPEPKEGLVRAVIGGTFGTEELPALMKADSPCFINLKS